MNRAWLFLSVAGVLAAGLAFHLGAQSSPAPDGPRFTANGQLQRPASYREWIWLSSGLGMSYNQAAQSSGNPAFDNVFVNPAAYRAFLATGTWPDHTVLVLEARASQSHGSINQQGHYQGARLAMEVEVKDARRFPGQWAFFGFEGAADSAAPIPRTASCYSCHARNGAVDNTFIQFYPTLLEVALQKGTVKPVPETPVR